MKRIFSLIIALCLVLGSFSFAFAAATDVSDSTTHTRLQTIINYLQNYMPTYGGQTTMNNNLSGILNQLGFTSNFTFYDALAAIESDISTFSGKFTSGFFLDVANTAYRLSTTNAHLATIVSYLDPTNTSSLTGVLNNILKALSDTSFVGSVVDYTNRILSTENSILTSTSNINTFLTSDSGYTFNNFLRWNSEGSATNYGYYEGTNNGSLGYQLANGLKLMNNTMLTGFVKVLTSGFTGFNSTQTYTDWTDLTSSTFTPVSATNGIYSWLSNIQTPVARLSYVLASDQDIEARQAAEDNQQAVVDDFIDSSGSGSVGVSDFGSLSDASGAMKTNFNTGQSASGVFNVFDDQHFGYLSQGTADSLDTTGSNTRLLKASGNEYPTPTLDKYYEELNKILEVNTDD